MWDDPYHHRCSYANQNLSIISTGASGYIGGDILAELIIKYPAYNYRALVRSQDSGQKIEKAYPNVTIVYGSLDDSELLTNESSKADIIIRKELAHGKSKIAWFGS